MTEVLSYALNHTTDAHATSVTCTTPSAISTSSRSTSPEQDCLDGSISVNSSIDSFNSSTEKCLKSPPSSSPQATVNNTLPVFQLDHLFIEQYVNIKPAFGFNGLGEMVYLRTYSRIRLEDGKNEVWYQTVERVVN